MRESVPTYDDREVRDISVEVYKALLGAEDTRRMIDKDRDNGEKLRERASSYDRLTRCYLDVLNAAIPRRS